jgi:uncharacterized protein YodC (DUF2158 family)
MNQPKFKFGDKVQFKNGGETFTVIRIEYSILKNYFTYSDDRFGGWDEELELYQEPKAKKLFAYKSEYSGGWVYFNESPDNKQSNWFRAPEYDLEYPSEEVK